MHLDEDYEAIKGQILLMDTLSSVNKACLMIERTEQQKQVNSNVTSAKEITAVAKINKFYSLYGNTGNLVMPILMLTPLLQKVL